MVLRTYKYVVFLLQILSKYAIVYLSCERRGFSMAKKKDALDELYDILNSIQINKDNIDVVNEAKQYIQQGEYKVALRILKEGIAPEDLVKAEPIKKAKRGRPAKKNEEDELLDDEIEEEDIEEEDVDDEEEAVEEQEEVNFQNIYPQQINSTILERQYIGMLLNDLPSISKFYILYDDCFFVDNRLLEIYKMILFTDADKYAPGIARDKFNFANVTAEINALKLEVKEEMMGRKVNMEKIYVELRKLFTLRKSFLGMPIKDVQDKIVDIVNYKLYDRMSIEEVESAIVQVTVTKRFKQSVLNDDLSDFLIKGENNLTNGLDLPFPILTSVFKGIRKGETMAFAMPSNAGKSRFTLNLAASVAFAQKKKVLIISNEMSEDKMRLCLITTILNNERFWKFHGQKMKKSESELLEFKFRPDAGKKVKVDENGFVLKDENETQAEFAERLKKVSTEFNNTIKVTDWVNEEINNSLYFVNITDHTNDELQKIVMNYYYKEQIEYIFYDTLKNDTANIGNAEEVKKTATILSNLAQNFGLFICSTLQLTESSTLPVNLNVNDLSASRTVKEVLDTLCLCKQIHNEYLKDYEYSLNEVDTEFFELEKFDDPDVRYYACVVDKNRAGAKPKVLFRLNLAYNFWEELGYVRLKQFEE